MKPIVGCQVTCLACGHSCGHLRPFAEMLQVSLLYAGGRKCMICGSEHIEVEDALVPPAPPSVSDAG